MIILSTAAKRVYERLYALCIPRNAAVNMMKIIYLEPASKTNLINLLTMHVTFYIRTYISAGIINVRIYAYRVNLQDENLGL